MEEYINKSFILELINQDAKYKDVENDYQRGCNDALDWLLLIIKNIPTVLFSVEDD